MKKIYSAATLFVAVIMATAVNFGLDFNTVQAEDLPEQGNNYYYYLFGYADDDYYKMKYNDTDSCWKYNSTQLYAMLDDKTAHPGSIGDIIKAWRAPADGTLNLEINTEHNSTSGDGVILKFGRRDNIDISKYGEYSSIYNDYTLFNETQKFSFTNIAVKRGDLILISVNKNKTDANDSTGLLTSATFTKSVDGIDYGEDIGDCRNLDVTGYYSSKQGENGWFYAYGTVEKYVLMTYGNCNDGNRAWRGAYPYQQIGADYMHPAERWSTLRIWIADSDGKISIEGNIHKFSPYGDGVGVGIYHNTEKIWGVDIEGPDDNSHKITDTKYIDVKAGDTIIIALSQGEHFNNSSDGTSFMIELYYESRSGNTVEGELSKYLSAVEYEGDLLDVIHVDYPMGDNTTNNESKSGCGSLIEINGLIVSLSICLAAIVRRKRV
jgi:hypothetical protein